MDLLALVDRLEELVGSAQKMPIGSRAIVDRRRLLDIVDQMRIAIPQEVREAREMVAAREQHRLESEEDARLIIAQAEDRAARMVEAHELTLAARKRAEEIAALAEQRLDERIEQANADIEHRLDESRRLAQQQMDAADEYARELLQRLDRQLQAFVRSVQSGIAQLDDTMVRTAPPAPEPALREPTALYESRETLTPEPIPLRRDEPLRPTESLRPTEGGLENLLRRRPGETSAGPVDRDPRDLREDDEDDGAPVIIDDFEMPDFDDGPRRDDDRGER
ncbi:MAG: hypothetical protein WC211_09385 [Dehalococcoidia bacterium]